MIEVEGPSVRSDDSQGSREGRIGAEALFREHATFVAGFLARLGVPMADVDDLVQEVFLVVHRKGGFELGPAHPRSWLGAIAVRVASTRRRSVSRRRELGCEAVVHLAESQAATPEARFDQREALGRVQLALESLDLEHRSVFVLYELMGEPCQAIATSFDLPIGTVYSRLHNARRRFTRAHAALVSDEAEETEVSEAMP